MLLADRSIRESVADGIIQIEPFEPGNVQPTSVDVRLGDQFQIMIPGSEPIDPRHDSAPFFRHVTVESGAPLYMEPGGFALASTYERVTLPDQIAARVEGRSSVGRLGLTIHVTAGYIDPCFSGTVTLELSNLAPRPILLWPGMTIGQLVFEYVNDPVEQAYGTAAIHSRYQGQTGPTVSRIHLGFTHGLPPAEHREAA